MDDLTIGSLLTAAFEAARDTKGIRTRQELALLLECSLEHLIRVLSDKARPSGAFLERAVTRMEIPTPTASDLWLLLAAQQVEPRVLDHIRMTLTENDLVSVAAYLAVEELSARTSLSGREKKGIRERIERRIKEQM